MNISKNTASVKKWGARFYNYVRKSDPTFDLSTKGYGTIDLFMMLTEKYNKSQLCKRRRSY